VTSRGFSRTRRAVLASCGIALIPFVAFLILDAAFPFPAGALRRAPAVVVADRAGEPLRVFLPPDQTYRFPVKLAEVSPDLKRAVIALEDRWFYLHQGVNPIAIARACLTNLRARRVVSGASTLTMQIARMSEPAPRTLTSKCREAFRALQLEWHYGKDDLLEIYLNMAPYGGNIEGVGAASWLWFGKPVERISLGEAALLAVLPRSPAGYDLTLHPEAARSARDRALDRLASLGVFSERQIAAARLEPVPSSRRRLPFAAPHFTQMAIDAFPGEARLVTTLDRRTQRAVEQAVAARISDLRRQGVGNAAVVVIENETRAVRAMVGSAGFTETAFQGQVNGAIARRSPGSALKPFLYALAFDAGRIVPESFLLDVPTDFAGYVPENYDGQYRGQVTAREALVQSLNAPAVRLLSETGVEPFLLLLRRGGLRTLDRPPAQYGLPLILGSGEVTLLDLTNLYATLAQSGRHAPWRTRASGAAAAGDPILSPESARLVTEILSELKRPDMPAAWDLTRDAPAVAWKTGTSYGHRDAWAIGFSARMTIGVWVGNLDGRATKGISGAEHAGPLLFDLFRSIEGGATRLPERPGLRIESVQVCALTHALPGPFCPHTVTIRYMSGRTRLAACTLHRRVFVDDRTGLILAGDCLASRPHHAEVIETQPAELIAWRREQGLPIGKVPEPSPDCRDVPAEQAPRIVSPSAATPYRLRRDAPAAFQQIPLVARAGAGSGGLFWYQDGSLAAQGPAGAALFLPPSPGRHRLVLVDSAGRSDSISYTVE
jgi:penicillin-binding protein 1C